MPWAARADSEYLAGTLCGGWRISVSAGSDDEHTPPTLRHSEETAVENPPSHAVPEVGQRSKHDSEVPTAVAREETRYVLDENPSGSKSVDDPGVLEEQPGSFPGESGAFSGDGEVLAGEAAAEEIRNGVCVNPPGSVSDGDTSIDLSSRRWFDTHSSYVVVDGDSGPTGGEHLSPPFVPFAEEGVLVSRGCEAVVHSADPAEEASDAHTYSPSSRAS